MHEFWDWLQSARGELLTAGFLGAVVTAVMEWQGVVSTIRKIIVGTISALYLSPLAVPLLSAVLGVANVPEENATGLSGFIVGVTGVVLIEIILKAFRMYRRDLKKASENGEA